MSILKTYGTAQQARPTEEDFVPPGPDPAAVGLEQLFDLVDDPWETKNLAGDPEYAGAPSDCRGILFRFEARLHRRPLRDGRPRDVVRTWAGPLCERWAAIDQ